MAVAHRITRSREIESRPRRPDVLAAASTGGAGCLESGAVLPVGGAVHAPGGLAALVMQPDGNLVLYARRPHGTRVARWASGTRGQTVTACVMQTDGNLVLYNGVQPVWASGPISSGARLHVQDDEDLVIYHGTNPIWATNTSLDGTPVKGRGAEVFHLLDGVRHLIPDEETLDAQFGGWGAVTTVHDDALDLWVEGEPAPSVRPGLGREPATTPRPRDHPSKQGPAS